MRTADGMGVSTCGAGVCTEMPPCVPGGGDLETAETAGGTEGVLTGTSLAPLGVETVESSATVFRIPRSGEGVAVTAAPSGEGRGVGVPVIPGRSALLPG